MLFLLRTSSCHFSSLYCLTLLITNQTLFRVPEISLKSKDKKETKQELEKRKNTLLDNDLGKQKEIQKANFYILNTQEKLHWIRVRELLTGFTIYNGFTMACILQLLFPAIATNFMFVTICKSFCQLSVQAFLDPLHQAKALTFPTLQLHWVNHQKTGHLHILHLQQVLVLLFSILSNKCRLKACKFILLYFPPNCEVFITKSQPKLHS